MGDMNPLDAAFVQEALEAIDQGSEAVNMRDGHSAFWGADQLAAKMESVDHPVEWIYHNTKQEEGGEHAKAHEVNLRKCGGGQMEWDDGFLYTKMPNINGLEVKQAVAGCHTRFGFTGDVEDTHMFEHGYYVSLEEGNVAYRGVKGGRADVMCKYDLHESFTVRLKNNNVTVAKNDDPNPFEVIAQNISEGTSMHGMIHIKERDALGQIEHLYAIALVTSVDINGNSIGDVGVERLMKSMEVPFTKVVYLDLGLNRIRDAGALHVAQVIEKPMSKITSLVLSHNEIGDEGAGHLAEALGKEPCSITKIWLAGNQIGNEGGIKIAEMLETEHNKLEYIELSWNQIEDEGTQRLIQAISKAECKLTDFALDHNKYTEKKTRKMLCAIMTKVPRLVHMT